MPRYKYLIVGGGMTAAAAIRGIRDADPGAEIGLVGAEPDPPYNRPPLSKDLWKGKPEKNLWRKLPADGLQMHLGRNIVSLNPSARQATDDQGNEYLYDRLLIATGGSPRHLPDGGDDLVYFRTLADYRRLREAAGEGKSFAVIGGGFIGSEIAAALALNGTRVAIMFPGSGIGARVFPAGLAGNLVEYYRERGVDVHTGTKVGRIEPRGQHQAVLMRDAGGAEHEMVVDGVVAGLGIEPNVDLARQAGLAVENGIVVDELLRTSDPTVFAAGDVAAFWSPALGMRMRVEHEDNANTMGRRAGRAMAGQGEPYHHQPFFYSDLFDLGYEAVGQTDSRLETVEDWLEPYRTGVVYYLEVGRVRGVLLWNVWEQVDAARRLIAEPGPFRPEDLKGRLPEGPK